MKLSAIISTVVFLLVVNSPVLANETFQVLSDSTMDGNAGFLVRITEPGYVGETLFMFEETGMIRVYAFREDGSTWDVLPGSQFLCPATTMNISDTWRFMDEVIGETVAEVVALESITTSAGTFSSYKVDIEYVSDPGNVIGSVWFSSGVGMVRQTDVIPTPWQSDLFSFGLTGGSGFFPLSTGNIWNFQEIPVPVEATSWGAIKSRFE